MTFDVILIGSGISSLVSAALLAKRGRRVLVLEQHSKPGGYLHCFKRFGQRFDTGAHYVGAMQEGQPFHALLKYLGLDPEALFVPLRDEGFDVFHFPEFKIEIPRGYSELADRLCREFPSEAPAIHKFLSETHEVAMNFPTYGMKADPDLSLVARSLDRSLLQVVEGLTSNPKLQSVFYTYCVLHGVEPRDISFGLHAMVFDSFLTGPAGLRMGGDALAEAFVDKIRSFGGEVLTEKTVCKIETLGDLATAVVTADGARYQSEWVISGIHPKLTLELIGRPELFSPAFRSRLAKIKESPGLFGIYALLKDAGDIDPLRNYFMFGSSDPSRLLELGRPDQMPNGIFICPADRLSTGPRLAINIHAPGPLEWFQKFTDSRYGKRSEDYHRLKLDYSEHVFQRIEQFWPGIRSRIDKFATSTPLSNLHFNGTPEGSSYGIYHSMQNTGVRALGPRTHVANLLLTGQNTLLPGLLGASVSGMRTAGHIIGIKPVLRELGASI